MHDAAPGLVPKILAFGTDPNSRPYFISEYKDLGRLSDSAAQTLGKRLATEMHAYESPQDFGFGQATYCGATRQKNEWFKTWGECYDSMIGDLLSQLKSYTELYQKGEELRKR